MLLLLILLSALSPVSLSISARVASVPATIRATIHISPDQRNRQLCYGFDGPEYKSHCEEIDERSPMSWQVDWSIRSGGEYEAFAEVIRNENGHAKHYLTKETFTISSPF